GPTTRWDRPGSCWRPASRCWPPHWWASGSAATWRRLRSRPERWVVGGRPGGPWAPPYRPEVSVVGPTLTSGSRAGGMSMGEFAGFDLDRSTERAWSRFQARLADHLAEMDDDDVLVVSADSAVGSDAEGSAPYVQFRAW